MSKTSRSVLYLSDDVSEGLVKLLVDVGQLLEVAVVFVDGHHDLVHLVHRLKHSRLQHKHSH